MVLKKDQLSRQIKKIGLYIEGASKGLICLLSRLNPINKGLFFFSLWFLYTFSLLKILSLGPAMNLVFTLVPLLFVPNSYFSKLDLYFVNSYVFCVYIRFMLTLESIIFGSWSGLIGLGSGAGIIFIFVSGNSLLFSTLGYFAWFLILLYIRYRNTFFIVGDLSSGLVSDIREDELEHHWRQNLKLEDFRLIRTPSNIINVYKLGSYRRLSSIRDILRFIWFHGPKAAVGFSSGVATYIGYHWDQLVGARNEEVYKRLTSMKAQTDELRSVSPPSLASLEKKVEQGFIGFCKDMRVSDVPVYRVILGSVENRRSVINFNNAVVEFRRAHAQEQARLAREQAQEQARLAREQAREQARLAIYTKQEQARLAIYTKQVQDINSWNAGWGGAVLGKHPLPSFPEGLSEHKARMSPVFEDIQSRGVVEGLPPRIPCVFEEMAFFSWFV